MHRTRFELQNEPSAAALKYRLSKAPDVSFKSLKREESARWEAIFSCKKNLKRKVARGVVGVPSYLEDYLRI